MPNYEGAISGFVVGDDIEIERAVPDIPVSAVIERAWLTIKRTASNTDSNAVFQLVVTSAYAAGAGQITDIGDGLGAYPLGTGFVRFEVGHNDSARMRGGRRYFYDIQVRSDSGKIATIEKGTIEGLDQITDAI